LPIFPMIAQTSSQVEGKITSVLASFDGWTWYALPITIAVPERVALRTFFEITTEELVNVRNVITLTYGEQTTTFISDVGTVSSGAYFFGFVFEFQPGFPLGPVAMKNELQSLLEGEWTTLDTWEGKFADISYKLLGRITAIGRRINEILVPLPFSVPAKEPFVLGIEGFTQVPTAGKMTLEAEIYTPTGEIVRKTFSEELKEPTAVSWKIDLPLEFEVIGIYPGRIRLFFNNIFLHGLEGRLFEITGVPAPAPPSPVILALNMMTILLFLGFFLKLIRGGVNVTGSFHDTSSGG